MSRFRTASNTFDRSTELKALTKSRERMTASGRASASAARIFWSFSTPSPSSDGALVSTAAVATAGLAELLGEREAHGSRRQPAQHGPTRDRPNPAGALRERDEHRAEVCLDSVPRCFANEEADQHCTRGVKPFWVIAQRGPVLEARVRRPCAGAPRVRRNRGRDLACNPIPHCRQNGRAQQDSRGVIPLGSGRVQCPQKSEGAGLGAHSLVLNHGGRRPRQLARFHQAADTCRASRFRAPTGPPSIQHGLASGRRRAGLASARAGEFHFAPQFRPPSCPEVSDAAVESRFEPAEAARVLVLHAPTHARVPARNSA